MPEMPNRYYMSLQADSRDEIGKKSRRFATFKMPASGLEAAS